MVTDVVHPFLCPWVQRGDRLRGTSPGMNDDDMIAAAAPSVATHCRQRARSPTLQYIVDHELQANALAVGGRLRQRLVEKVSELSIVGEIRGKGLMIGVALVVPGTVDPSSKTAAAVFEEARRNGLLWARAVSTGTFFGFHRHCRCRPSR